MPTGYTHAVADGTVTEFSDFAMQCARAFGALITMRDEPFEAPIPQVFEPSDHNAKALAAARERLARLTSLTVDQQQTVLDSAHQEEILAWERNEAGRKLTKQRYEQMLDAVNAWPPPSHDHVAMKRFMRDQLLESIRFDCHPPRPRPEKPKRSDWVAAEIAKAQRDVEYHTAEHGKEVDRARSRTEWVAALRRSLGVQ